MRVLWWFFLLSYITTALNITIKADSCDYTQIPSGKIDYSKLLLMVEHFLFYPSRNPDSYAMQQNLLNQFTGY